MISSIQSYQDTFSAFNISADQKPSAEKGETLDKLSEEIKSTTDSYLSDNEEFSARDKLEIQKLQRRDRGVHQHEMMHRIYAGEHARGHITYKYEVGPDGKRYAVHGEVSIDAAPVPGNPEKTIEKMAAIRRAATAPRDPSSADRRAAMMAQRAEAAARADLRQKEAEEAQEEKRLEDIQKMSSSNGPESVVMNANQVVNEFRSTVRPELVSNLFDLFA